MISLASQSFVGKMVSLFFKSRRYNTAAAFAALYWCALITATNQLQEASKQRPASGLPDSTRLHELIVSETCYNAYKNMTKDELSRFIDASGTRGSGIYGGNTLWFGSFSECKKQSDARYCLTVFPAVITLVENKSESFLSWGVCIPASCNKTDVVNGLEFYLHDISRIRDVKPFSQKVKVECAEDPEYTTGVIFTITFFGLIFGLCLVASLLEIFNGFLINKQVPQFGDCSQFRLVKEATEETPIVPDNPSQNTKIKDKRSDYIIKIMRSFSSIRNIKFIMNTNVGKRDLTYLHGIRVFSLFWIILLHVRDSLFKIPLSDNRHDMLQFLRRRSSMIFTNGVLGVDTFFLLSGLLVIYVTLMKREKNNEKVNWIKFYVHRFWRLTPSYMLAILFLTKLRPFFGDGPLWFRGRDTSACEDNWWTNLLYINNFVHIKHVCIPPSWYLSADMQFFIISPLLIIIAYRYGFRVLSMVGSIIIFASALTTAIILGKEDLNPVPFPGNQRPEELYDYAEYVYFKPYSRIPPYIFGIILGYGVYKYFSQQFRMNRYIAFGAWTLAVGVALAVIYAPHNSIKEDPHVWTKGEKAIYGGLRWILWSMCVSWLIFACHYGYAGPIKDILAAKFWIPLSRINYAAFILHYDIIEVIFLNVEAPFHFTTFTLVTYYLSALVLSYSCAFIFAVVIELPCSNLESVLLKKW